MILDIDKFILRQSLYSISFVSFIFLFFGISFTVFAATGPDLTLYKGDSGMIAEPGGEVIYTLIYNNLSDILASGVVLTETVPIYTTFNAEKSTSGWSCQPDSAAGSVCTLTVDTLPPKKGGLARFAVTIADPLPDNLITLENTAYIGHDGGSGADPDPENNSASETTPTFDGSVPGLVYVYLPLVGKNSVTAPDLVIDTLLVNSQAITMTITNQGNRPVVDAFWVDLYINPTTPPTGVNQRWQDLGAQGATWGVTDVPITPGGTLTLTLDTARPDLSSFALPPTPGTSIYAQVDSVNLDTIYGGVLELHEIGGGTYNNIIGPVSVQTTHRAVVVSLFERTEKTDLTKERNSLPRR